MSIEKAQRLTESAITEELKKRLSLLLETKRRVQHYIDATLDALHEAISRE